MASIILVTFVVVSVVMVWLVLVWPLNTVDRACDELVSEQSRQLATGLLLVRIANEGWVRGLSRLCSVCLVVRRWCVGAVVLLEWYCCRLG